MHVLHSEVRDEMSSMENWDYKYSKLILRRNIIKFFIEKRSGRGPFTNLNSLKLDMISYATAVGYIAIDSVWTVQQR